ncbi:MAG: biotin/lipoyl-binding protein [Clostridiales bacterium]|nr:biotin/lipoyl-binding protein [Clostridiales bacterium]
MRKFNITVNGVAYEVEVEEVGAGSAPAAPVAAAPAPVAAPAPAPKAAPAPAPKAAPVAGGTKINAPMPGVILDVKAAVGASVKKGDILLVLEAMKMENEIVSPVDGTVAQVLATKGSSVNSGDVLVVLN